MNRAPLLDRDALRIMPQGTLIARLRYDLGLFSVVVVVVVVVVVTPSRPRPMAPMMMPGERGAPMESAKANGPNPALNMGADPTLRYAQADSCA